MLLNYFFIDGSALGAQIRVLRRKDRSFENRRLDVADLIKYFSARLDDLGAHEFKRATFYFPKGDEVAIEEYIIAPDYNRLGAVRDVHFKFCGQKLKGSAEYTTWVETSVPAKWRDRVSKSEKGVDIEICCNALKLASASRLERLFFLTNDDDFLPMCRTLKEFGANISLIHLTDFVAPNTSLVSEVDSYDVVRGDALQALFFPPFTPGSEAPRPAEVSGEPSGDKGAGPALDVTDTATDSDGDTAAK
ncbi:MAG: NYN domain-containing protein [Xanthobacteraceae bacterium]